MDAPGANGPAIPRPVEVPVPAEMGKRYECAELGAHYLITRGGDGELSCVEATPEEADRLGKRYQDASSGIMVLCTKSGLSRICCNGAPMEQLAPKALPSSD